MNRWIVVDEMNDAFDCDNCPAMVSRPYNYCPRCGDKKFFIETYFDIVDIHTYREIYFPNMEDY